MVLILILKISVSGVGIMGVIYMKMLVALAYG
jgi:hypothetical protein